MDVLLKSIGGLDNTLFIYQLNSGGFVFYVIIEVYYMWFTNALHPFIPKILRVNKQLLSFIMEQMCRFTTL